MDLPPGPIELLQDLVRIPSVNPDGDPDGHGEGACAEFVASFLENCGAAVRREEVRPDRPNVIGRFPGPADGPGVLFAPHTDTVSVAGMTVEPFGGERRDDRIYGRGASDTKGTMAAMLWALHQHREEIPKLPVRIAFAGLMGEESGQPGSKHFAARHAGEFDFALVGEPTRLETVHAHKGSVCLALTTRGRPCHSSTPERGENAVRRMLPLLERLLDRLEAALPSHEDPRLGPPTVSLGAIRGGSSANIVPAECRAVLDCRETLALRAAGGCHTLIESILEDMGAVDTVEVEVLSDAAPLMTDPETDGVQRLLSIGSTLATAPWFCDAGPLAEGGIPAVASGPGDIAQAHTRDEYLAIADLEAGVDFYGRFLRAWAS